ncbi:hypothetical protein ABZ865_34005 [Streptomyces sp. NPDC047085]|uniref:effector-associated constant component EACC1 n=1 Tax=Streptomyces sp. NPDC047085 TaxID=3155140 RepID=UPI0033FB08C9
MRIVITVDGGRDGSAELRRWLTAEPRLRGRIRLDTQPPPPGAMGSGAMDALIAILEPGGVATVFAGAVVAWATSRRSSQTITVTRPDGTQISIESTQVRADAAQAAELVERLAATITDPPAPEHRAEPDSATPPRP